MPGSLVTLTNWDSHIIGNQGYVTCSGAPSGWEMYNGTFLLTLDEGLASTYPELLIYMSDDLGSGARLQVRIYGVSLEIGWGLGSGGYQFYIYVADEPAVLTALNEGFTLLGSDSTHGAGRTTGLSLGWGDYSVQWLGTELDGVPAGGSTGSLPCAYVPPTKSFGPNGDLLSMLKNTIGQKIGAQMITAADGTDFTGSVTVKVCGDAGTQATGSVGSGACTHEGGGYHTYAPSQAETNYDLIAFTFQGSGAITNTVQVATQAASGGSGDITSILGTALTETSAGYLAAAFKKLFDVASPVLTAASVNQTGDSYARVGANGAGLTDLATQSSVNTVAGYIDTEVAAIKAKTDQLTFTVANQVDANTLTGGGTGLSSDITAIKAKTDNLPSDPADASVVAGLIGGLDTKLDTIDNYIDTEVAAIKAKTDQLTFTVANQVDANALSATGATVCKYGACLTTTAGVELRITAWLEQNGQAVVLPSGTCTVTYREHGSGTDLFTITDSAPNAQGIFELTQSTPGFTSDRLQIASVEIDDGDNVWLTRHAVPIR